MILYFTGTGNSAWVARRLSKQLNDDTLNLFERIRDNDFSPLSSKKAWVIVCPTYAWQIPHILQNYLKQLPLTGASDVYFVLTCGGSVGNAQKNAKSLAKSIGLRFCGLASVVMPENYIAMFRVPYPDQTEIILENAEEPIAEIGNKILAGDFLSERITITDKILSGIVNSCFYTFSVKDKKFVVTDKCCGCGYCATLCPTNNIKMNNNKPIWHGNCTHCMACICHCPAEAIEYGTNSIGQVRYQCPDL